MDKTKIIENNELIALHLGKTYKDNSIIIGYWNVCNQNPTGATWQEPQYHKDWNWLMEAVNFIYVNYPRNKVWSVQEIASALKTADIELVYKAVVDYIEWYNKEPK